MESMRSADGWRQVLSRTWLVPTISLVSLRLYGAHGIVCLDQSMKRYSNWA